MRTGYELGYDVITLKDCTAAVSEQARQGALEHDFPMFSHPMNHQDFLEGLGASGKPEESLATAR
jgi:ureidoacrylate peracid hydrolase